MLDKLKNSRVIFVIILVIVLLSLIVTACSGFDLVGLGGQEEDEPESAIIAPVRSGSGQIAKVFVDSPIHIQSIYTDETISRVELLVQHQDDAEPRLLRADIPADGGVTQQWIPARAGRYTVTTVAYTTDNEPQTPLVIQVDALPSQGRVSIPVPEPPSLGSAAVGTPTPASTQVPIILARPTEVRATPVAPGNGDTAARFPEVRIQVLETAEIQVKPTPTALRYPPPPPAPGVPPGPTQDQMPKKIPPVCDAAEFISVFVENPNRRDFLPGPDDLPVKVAAGTLVHRAWRLRNIGTCTWGPGYELAFYGGRSMGSGGVAFESTFPSDIRPRNRLLDTNRLILAEGKPNQTAVLEVLLNTPAYPGIHQSYWRMRNPQGVYFGPILGVTMDVVRDCNQPGQGGPRIYGAPVASIRVLGVDGNLVGANEGIPGAGPLPVEVGQLVTFDWNVFNATSFQLIVENPVGDLEIITTADPRDRANFTPTTVGLYTITLYAENGACAVEQQIELDVRPPSDEQFVFRATFASSAPINLLTSAVANFSTDVTPGTFQAEWEHYNDNVDQILFNYEVFELAQSCWFGDYFCTDEWRRTRSGTLGAASDFTAPGGVSIGTSPVGQATLSLAGGQVPRTELGTELPGEATTQGIDATMSSNEHAVRLGCPSGSVTNQNQTYRVVYVLEAQINGQPVPERPLSNPVEFLCGISVSRAR